MTPEFIPFIERVLAGVYPFQKNSRDGVLQKCSYCLSTTRMSQEFCTVRHENENKKSFKNRNLSKKKSFLHSILMYLMFICFEAIHKGRHHLFPIFWPLPPSSKSSTLLNSVTPSKKDVTTYFPIFFISFILSWMKVWMSVSIWDKLIIRVNLHC